VLVILIECFWGGVRHAKSSRSMFDTGRSSLAAVDRRPVFFPEKRLRLPRFVVESWPESVSQREE
jgi:hypothetical protein